MFAQLPLKIGLREEARFDTFVAEKESIAVAIAGIESMLLSTNSCCILLAGEKMSGKTHILQSSCRFFSENNQKNTGSSTVYLPLADKSLPFVPLILNGLENVNLICIDDVDEIVGDKDWEVSLANLIVKSQTQGQKLMLSSRMKINDWQLITKELSRAMVSVSTINFSRLKASSELIEALKKRSEHFGFDFRLEIGNYLIKQFSNDLSELIAALQIIENASIIQKRKITLPFVKQILSETNIYD